MMQFNPVTVGLAASWQRCLVLVPAVLLVAVTASGFWEKLSPGELVEQSELVVIGQLVESEVDGAFGAIQVTETLKGDRHETAILGGRTELMSSDAINYRVGITGLWFLRSATNSDDAAYLADHPQRFVSDVREIAVWRDRLQ